MNICEKDKCVGCGLCSFVCPVKCIKIVSDEKGFLVPNININVCVKCGKCQKHCPANNASPLKHQNESQYYLVWSKSDSVRYDSSSGGAFTALADAVLKKGGVVIGAAYNTDFTVCHKVIHDKEKLGELRKSKYMQSDTTGVFDSIKANLATGKIVLFSGTPCQCAAVKSAFPHNENLLLCDLICHAVQSPEVFSDALKYMENKYGSSCEFIDFRSKTKGWANACTTVVKFRNGKIINKRLNDIPIGAGFSRNLSIRSSCESCQYRSMERVGDITIGDFWAIRDEPKYLKEFGDLGYSSVLINSHKGKTLFDWAKHELVCEERTREEIQRENGPLYRQFKPNPLREKFWSDYSTNQFSTIWKRYLRQPPKTIIKWRVTKFARRTGLLKLYRTMRGVK